MRHGPGNPRVLHVLYRLARGGTENQCVSVATRLSGHFVAVVRGGGELRGEVAAACGPPFELKIRKMFSRHTFRRIDSLSEHIRRRGIDMVHAWDSDGAIFGAAAARRARVPWVTSRRDLGEIYSWWKLHLMNRSDRKAVAVVVNGEAIRERLLGHGISSGRIHLIRNCVNVDRFSPGRTADGKSIALVSRLDPEKDVALALHVMQQIVRAHPGVVLKIAGRGRELDALHRLACSLDLGDAVDFLGNVSDVPALLAESRLGILTSRSNEGLSNAVLEYMAASLPVVVTDCGGNRELVRHRETGYVVSRGDTDAFSDAVNRVLANPGLGVSMGRKGREVVACEHVPEIVLERFRCLYQEIHERGHVV